MDHNSYKTTNVACSTLKKEWVLVDAKNKVLGRLSSEIAKIIRGKNKPSFTPHMDMGDHVIVINAEKIQMTGKKWTDRVLLSHSGYTGGQRERSPLSIHSKHPERLVEHAVRGMLPKNRLGRKIFKNLHVYRGDQHPHEAQQSKVIKL